MMTKIDTTKTVRELAVESPGATRVFERMRIDYCCGGARPLAEACEAAGVEVAEVMRMLGEAQAAQVPDTQLDLQTCTLERLIDYILDKHHAYVREEMTRIAALLEKVTTKHGANHPELASVGALVRRLFDDLGPHMMKEEMVLFPYVRALEAAAASKAQAPFAPFGTVSNPIRMMMFEHDAAGDILRDLRAATGDYTPPADGCFTFQTLYRALDEFEQDLHQHIHLENNVLFPRAVELEENNRQ